MAKKLTLEERREQNYRKLAEVAYGREVQRDVEGFIQKMNEVLETLTPREEKILREYFGLDQNPKADEIGDCEPKTLKNIAAKYDIDVKRLTAYRDKGLRKLAHVSREEMLLDFIATENELEMKKENEERAERLRQEKKEKFKKLSEITLEELPISVRAYNCLHYHSGVQSVADLATMTREDLIKIRYLGGRCADEIIDALAEIGVEIKSAEEQTEKPVETSTEKSDNAER